MEIEADSRTWRALRSYLVKEIETHTEQLISGASAMPADELRGRIKALREVLDLEKPKKVIVPENVRY